ncbi:MAG: hypothetical protein ABIH83_04175 [Candidatus Micrarchaeota archaeon]
MLLKLSKPEMLLLKQLCAQTLTPGQLAKLLNLKKSFIARILHSLSEKGLILASKQGTAKQIRLSPASHAQNFKKLSDSRPDAKMELWLCSKAMDILILASHSEGGINISLLQNEMNCSKPTMYKILNSLYSAGVAAKYGQIIKITDPLLSKFSNSYADNIQLKLQKKASGHNTSIRIRKHVVLNSDAQEVPSFFSKTGICALAEAGLEANISSYKDFYFNLDAKKRNLSMEESFIHALLISTLAQHPDLPLLILFFAKNMRRLDIAFLKKLAKQYSVEAKFEELRQAAGYYEKLRDFE